MSTFVGLDANFEHTYATVLDQDGLFMDWKRMMNWNVPDFRL